jgi:hypothetical protein
MKIELFNEAEGEAAAVGKACQQAFRWSDSYNADVYINPREAKGWLEYHIVIKRKEDNTRYLTVAMIQRDIGREYEFHS